MKENQRTKILEIAENLLREKGYNGWSYQHIASAMGIKKASIHYYFPRKEDLGCELLHHYCNKSQEALADSNLKSAKEKLEALIRLFGQVLDDPYSFCLYGMLAADLRTLPENMQAALKTSFENQKNWVALVLKEGVQNGEFSKRKHFEDEASLFVSSLQGMLLMARLEKYPQEVFFRNANLFLLSIV